MNIKKCNTCGKILDRNVDIIYTIGEISKHLPKSLFTRLVISKSENTENINQIQESWVDYSDIDLCEGCWEKSDFIKYTTQ